MLRGVVLGLAVVGLVAPMAFGQAVSFTVDPDPAPSPGQATVTMWFSGFTDLTTFEVQVVPGSAVSFASGATLGSALAAGFDGSDLQGAGQISWSNLIFPPVTIADPTAVATFDIDIAGGADASNSTIDAGPGSFFTVGVGANAVDISPMITGAVAVPEPATVALLLAGVSGGVLLRRRRRSA